MRVYLLKRLLLIPVTLLGITLITFLVMKLAPGDPSQILKAQFSGGNVQANESNKKAVEQWRKERHLDESLLNQYGYWLWDLARFDLGRSFLPPRQKVSEIIFGKIEKTPEIVWGRLLAALLLAAVLLGLFFRPRALGTPDSRRRPRRLLLAALAALSLILLFTSFRGGEISWGRAWITIIMNLIAFSIIYTVAIPIGIVGAAKQFTLWDRILTILPFILYSVPSFWLGTLMIAFLTGKIFPTTGFYPKSIDEVGFWTWSLEWARRLTLPIICETYAYFAFLSRQMRSSLLEQIRQDFVRTARAKGLSERVVILHHATRNALIPIVTLLGSLLPGILAGSVIIEYLFSIPGMGQLFFEAVLERDYHVLMGIETVSALLTLVGILVSDLLYVLVNPTISYE